LDGSGILLAFPEEEIMKIQRSTPVCIVDQIEPLLEFWEKKLGFKREAEVPHGSSLGFVLLKKDDQEMMFQTRASIEADLPALLPLLEKKPVIQFIEIDSLDDLLSQLKGVDVLVQPRTTFYGMREIGIQDPAGFILIFAQRV
jgi:hypothetical protein